MDKENSLKILQNLDFIASNVCSLRRLLNFLLQESVLNQVEVDAIKSYKTEYDAGTELANLICKKDDEKFPVFIKCLEESGNEVIAKRLMKTEIQDIFGKSLSKIGVEEISQLLGAAKEISQQIWFGVSAPNMFYTGRKKEEEILEKYWNNCITKKTFSIVAVTGLGGVGKSELATNFAKWFYESAEGHCIWIEAETNQSIQESFKNLAEDLKISLNDDLGKERKFLEIASEVYEKLFGKKVLIVFDNVENYDEEVLKLVRKLSSKKPPNVLKPFVVTTSRLCEAKKSFGTQCNHLDLQVLTKESAVNFFIISLSINEPSEDSTNELIEKLCQRLQFFPLAMQQASSYIHERLPFCGNVQEAIIDYLTKIEIETKTLLNYKLTEYEVLDDISKTTFLTWRITVEQLKRLKDGNIILNIMNIMSFLSPDNISIEILKNTLQPIGYGSDITHLCELIRKYSMINFTGKELISVHRLVQEVTRIELGDRGLLRSVLSNIANRMINIMEGKKVALKDLVHVQVVWQHVCMEKKMMEDYGLLSSWICNKLYTAGKYKDILDFSSQYGYFMESTLGENNRWTLKMRHWKGSALRFLGQFSESLQLLTDVYKRQKETFGDNNKDVLDTEIEVGVSYMRLKKYKNAMKFFKAALKKSENISGTESQQTLAIKNNMAVVLKAQKPEEALKVYEEVLEVKKRVLGVENPNTLVAMSNIAGLKLHQKNYQQALKEYQEVLKIQAKVLQLDHPLTLSTKSDIAMTYYHLDRYEESLQLLKEVHEKRVQILGPQHPDTIDAEKTIKVMEMDIAMERYLSGSKSN